MIQAGCKASEQAVGRPRTTSRNLRSELNRLGLAVAQAT